MMEKANATAQKEIYTGQNGKNLQITPQRNLHSQAAPNLVGYNFTQKNTYEKAKKSKRNN